MEPPSLGAAVDMLEEERCCFSIGMQIQVGWIVCDRERNSEDEDGEVRRERQIEKILSPWNKNLADAAVVP